MNVSYVKIAWYCITRRVGEAADYVLDLANAALARIDPKRKETISAAINTAMKCMGVLEAISWLIPTKWQRAYRHTIEALDCTVMILDDFSITDRELKAARDKYALALKSWKDPDDPTCVTLDDVMVED